MKRVWIVKPVSFVLLITLFAWAGSQSSRAQTFPADIQQFWNQLRTGGLVFTNIKATGGTISGVTISVNNPTFTGQWTVNGSLCAASMVLQGGAPTRCTATPTLGTATTVPGTVALGTGTGGGAVWTLASAATSNWTLTGAAVAPAQGDLLTFSNATGQMASVADVAVGQVLTSGGVGSVPVYSANPSVTSILAPIVKPAADSTTAIRLMKADGVTAVTTIDTTNSKITTANVIASSDFSCATSGGCTIGNAAGPSNVFVQTAVKVGGLSLMSGTTPTFTSGFGGTTGRSITGTSVAFSIVVGSSSTDNNGVLGLPTSSNGWVCRASNQTVPTTMDIKQSASTTASVTLTQYNTTTGVAANFAANDVIKGMCISY